MKVQKEIGFVQSFDCRPDGWLIGEDDEESKRDFTALLGFVGFFVLCFVAFLFILNAIFGMPKSL